MSDREINIDFVSLVSINSINTIPITLVSLIHECFLFVQVKLCTSITGTASSGEAMPPPGPQQPPCTPQGEASAHSLLFRSLDLAKFLHPAPAPQTVRPSTKKRHCNLVDMKESPEPKGPNSWKMKSLGGTCLKFLALFFKHEVQFEAKCCNVAYH